MAGNRPNLQVLRKSGRAGCGRHGSRGAKIAAKPCPRKFAHAPGTQRMIQIDFKLLNLVKNSHQTKMQIERAEMLDDIESFDRAMARLGSGAETFPASIAARLALGENPVKIFREYRGLTQRDLAEAAGISVPAISKIESSGKGSLETFVEIARRLQVDMEMLID